MGVGSLFPSCVWVIRLGDKYFYPESILKSRGQKVHPVTQFLPHVMVPPHHKIILMLLCNCNFTTVLNCDVIGHVMCDLSPKGL